MVEESSSSDSGLAEMLREVERALEGSSDHAESGGEEMGVSGGGGDARTPTSGSGTPAVGEVLPEVVLDLESGVSGYARTGRADDLVAEVGVLRDLDPAETVAGTVLTGGFLDRGNVRRPEGGEPDHRDPLRGKAVISEEETPRGIDPAEVMIRPPVGSSSAVPTVREDFAEFIGAANLARLDPGTAELIARLRAERLRDIALSDEAARLEREQERTRAREAEEAEEMMGPRIPAVEETRRWERPAFDADAYILPEPHLIDPSGFDPYIWRCEEYDPDLILRDPESHLSRTWTTVYLFKPPFSIKYCILQMSLHA